jgi:hypothetical protein
MDPIIRNYIKLQAKEIYSEDFINLRDELQSLKALLNMDSKNLKLRNQYALIYKKFQYARIQQSNKKWDIINKIMTKYPLLQHSDITPYIEKAIHCPSKEVILTIPAVYPKPTRSDMAVLLVYFNACSYKNLERNLKLTYQSLINAEIPVFLVEHLFKDQQPLFPENGTTIFNTRSDSYMFYKENLLNWLMPLIPPQFTKFYMMDCDLIFSSPRWYDDVSTLLDTHDVVHPFQEVIWLKSDLNTIDREQYGIIYADMIEAKSSKHSGFAWAFRRNFIEPIGMFDLTFMGSGDTIIGSAVTQKNYMAKEWNKLKLESYITQSKIYLNKFNGAISTYYNNNKVYHLWHGSISNRSYYSRYTEFNNFYTEHSMIINDNIFEKNAYGLYEYKENIKTKLNNIVFKYFKNRNEDEDENKDEDTNNDTIHLIMCCYKRHHHLKDIIKSVDNQTVASQIVFHIINTNPEKWDETIEIKNTTPIKNITIRLCNTGVNLYGYARFLYTKHLLKTETIPYVIFFDDDQLLPQDWIKKLYAMRQPFIYMCQYGVIFRRYDTVSEYSYFDRTFSNSAGNIKLNLPEKIDYGATSGCIVDTQIFLNDIFFRCPRPYRNGVEDLWLSYFVNVILCKPVQLFSISLGKSKFDDTEATALWHTIKKEKTDFLRLLVNTGFLIDNNNVSMDELNKILEPTDDSDILISNFTFSKKYLYLVQAPKRGFNDILKDINLAVEYCRKSKRILMIDTRKSCYTFCFDDYFYFKNTDIPIITDMNTIETIFSDTILTVYPDVIKDRDLKQFKFNKYEYNNKKIDLLDSNINIDADIIVYISSSNNMSSFPIFKSLYFKQNIIDHVKEQYSKLPSPYLCIQVRNTDRKCDYVSLYEINKELIHSYNSIYIATDDKDSLDFFRSKGLPIYNFTDFPSIPYENLHFSSIDPDIKIKNLICDIYIISMAEKLLTNSIGGFICLCRAIRKDINIITDKMQ